MTREKAIEYFESLLKRFEEMYETETSYWGKAHTETTIEATRLALSALRPVSREQVEKVFPGCDYCKHAWMEGLDLKPCASGNIGVELMIGRVSEDDAFGILAYYRNIAAGYIDFPFCPFCGRPMTEEAVQMVVERLEALDEKPL